MAKAEKCVRIYAVRWVIVVRRNGWCVLCFWSIATFLQGIHTKLTIPCCCLFVFNFLLELSLSHMFMPTLKNRILPRRLLLKGCRASLLFFVRFYFCFYSFYYIIICIYCRFCTKYICLSVNVYVFISSHKFMDFSAFRFSLFRVLCVCFPK